MAIQLIGVSTSTICDVDAGFKAQRVSIRPIESTGWVSVGAATQAITGAAINQPLFSLRNLAASSLIIRRIGIGATTVTAFTAPQLLEYGLIMCRNFTVSDTGGLQIAFSGSNAKVRTASSTVSSVDCRIATTAALTGGTKILDSNALSINHIYSAAVGSSLPSSLNNMYYSDTASYPIIIAQNEGINILNLAAYGAGGAVKVYVNIEFAEAATF